MAVDNFLGQLEEPQLVFTVRQRQLQNLDEAVTSTLELTFPGVTGQASGV